MSAPLTLADMPTLAALYRAGRIVTAPAPPDKCNLEYNAKISVIKYDITKLKIGAIVNAANERMLGGSGVDGAIHNAAGPGLKEECRPHKGCATGSAKITGAHRLPCDKIIHAVGPRYTIVKDQKQSQLLLAGCYRTSLELAVQNDVKSIAFSALSTGVFGYPSDDAAMVASQTVRDFFESGKGESLERVIFCNFQDKDQEAYWKALPLAFPPSDEEKAASSGTSSNKAESSKLDDPAPAPNGSHSSLGAVEQLPNAPAHDPAEAQGAPDHKKQKLDADDTSAVGVELSMPSKNTPEDTPLSSEGAQFAEEASQRANGDAVEDMPQSTAKKETRMSDRGAQLLEEASGKTSGAGFGGARASDVLISAEGAQLLEEAGQKTSGNDV